MLLSFGTHYHYRLEPVQASQFLWTNFNPQPHMTTRRNPTERRGAKFPLHKNIKPVLNPHLDSPLFVCIFFQKKTCIVRDSNSFKSQSSYQLIKSMINSLKIINWSYNLRTGMHFCMLLEGCPNSHWHLWLTLQPGRAFQVCLLRIYEQNKKMISFELSKEIDKEI